MIEKYKNLLGHIWRATPIVLSISVITFLMNHWGWLHHFETSNLDIMLRLKSHTEAYHTFIVFITDDDYKEIFHGKSPLNPWELQNIIRAIAEGKPKVIGVDLDLSEVKLEFAEEQQTFQEWPIIIWGQDALVEDGKITPLPVLGQKEPVVPTGLVLLPQDSDGIIRRYRHVLQVDHHPVDSFPWAVVKAYRHVMGEQQAEAENEFVFNFSGNRYVTGHMPVQDVLTLSKELGWKKDAPVRNKIVLLGGKYRSARDEYITAVGPMYGVELMAQAIESELRGGGIRHVNEILMVLMEIVIGYLLVALNYSFASHLRLALVLSLVVIPFLALAASFVAFSSLSRWANFIPLLIGVLLDQFYDHAKKYRKMHEELQQMRNCTP